MTDSEQRIRERAYRIWEEEGCPPDREQDHWERARFLVGIEENPEAGLEPNPMVTDREKGWTSPPPPEPIEPIEAIENQGEFPGRFTDQGDESIRIVSKSRHIDTAEDLAPPVDARPKEAATAPDAKKSAKKEPKSGKAGAGAH